MPVHKKISIKQCPFCGKRPKIERGGPGNIVWYVSCERDDWHQVNIQSSESREEAIELWNERA